MKKIRKIYVIACLHGNEVFGLKILGMLAEHGDSRIILKVGNPEATAKKCRFIESDLNRSFLTTLPTKEARLAQSITQEIKQHSPDLIIDIHTSTVDVGCVAILATKSDYLVSVAEQLLMNYKVVMPQGITKNALGGTFPDNCIVLEFGKNMRSDKLAHTVSKAIVSMLNSLKLPAPSSQNLFLVKRTVAKSETKGLEFKNYKYNSELKGYPFLMGEKNYKEIAGFLAQKTKL